MPKALTTKAGALLDSWGAQTTSSRHACALPRWRPSAAIFRLPADACSRLACRPTNATARQKR